MMEMLITATDVPALARSKQGSVVQALLRFAIPIVVTASRRQLNNATMAIPREVTDVLLYAKRNLDIAVLVLPASAKSRHIAVTALKLQPSSAMTVTAQAGMAAITARRSNIKSLERGTSDRMLSLLHAMMREQFHRLSWRQLRA